LSTREQLIPAKCSLHIQLKGKQPDASSDKTAGVEQVLIIDDAVTKADLSRLMSVVDTLEFHSQELGRGGFSTRSRATSDEQWIPDLIWNAVASSVQDLGQLFAAERERPNTDPPIQEWKAYGCNPTTRFYRYRAGAAFGRPVDEPWSISPTRRSVLTVLLYLNAGFCRGGETAFDHEVVAAEPGRIVVFNHLTPHEGRMVESGTKVTLRSDVLADAPRTNQHD
jgi:hypothetical protein